MTTHESLKHARVNNEIQVLRAFAVLMAIFSHINPLIPGGTKTYANLSQYVTGWAGVDLFFCISGYVISKSFVEEFDAYRIAGKWYLSAQAFWTRRFFRIVPSAVLWIAVPLICSIWINESHQFHSVHENVRADVAILLDLANFAGPQNLGPNPVYWSLSLEEQFYFVYPFFLLMTPIAWRWRILLALIAVQVIPDRSALFYSQFWLIRLEAIMWGCIIYQFSRTSSYLDWEPKFLKSKSIALLISLWLIAMLMMVPALLEPYLKVESIVGVLAAALIFLASFNKGYVFPPVWPFAPLLLWIGDRSYGLYLIHIPAISMTFEIWTRIARVYHLPPIDRHYGHLFMWTWLGLVVVLCELNYRIVETPLRRKGARLARKIASPLTSVLVEAA